MTYRFVGAFGALWLVVRDGGPAGGARDAAGGGRRRGPGLPGGGDDASGQPGRPLGLRRTSSRHPSRSRTPSAALAGAGRQGRADRLRGELRPGGGRGSRRSRRGWTQSSTTAPARLAAAGFTSRSAFLTSPTFGGISWLAHSTVQSGLWVDSQQRYDQLMDQRPSDVDLRTFGRGRAGGPCWTCRRTRTTGRRRRTFYRRGPGVRLRATSVTAARRSGSATIPDQYTLAQFQRGRAGAGGSRAGDGRDRPADQSHPLGAAAVNGRLAGRSATVPCSPASPSGRRPSTTCGPTPPGCAPPTAQTIEYSLSALISFVHDLRRRQPGAGRARRSPAGTDRQRRRGRPRRPGDASSARTRRSLAAIGSWGWQPGLHPAPDAPVWRMDAFHDRFLNTFDG